MVTFDNYRENYLEDQVNLIRETTKEWPYFNYPTVDQLKQTYSSEGFTPETRHYGFDGENLVAFVSSAIEDEEKGQASLQYPFVRNGFEELEQEIMDKAIHTLKEKGANHITSNLAETWEGADKVLEKYGFEPNQVLNKFFIVDTSSYDYTEEQFDEVIVEVDPEDDKEELIRVFSTEMTQSPEQIGQIIDGWVESDNIITNKVMKKDDKIISHSMVVKHNINPNIALMTHVSIYDEQYQHYRPILTKYLLQKLKEDGYNTVRFIGLNDERIKKYEEFNFPIYKTVEFKKDLS